MSPSLAIEKLDIIDNYSMELETNDTLDKFLLDLEFK